MKRFYGRKNDLSKLARVFEQTKKGGSGAVLLSGPAGSGKTALVTRFAVDAEKAGALFCYGKADLLFHNSPFSTLTTALNMLVKKAIAENPRGREGIKKVVRQSLNQEQDLGPVLKIVPSLSYLFETSPVSSRHPGIDDKQSVNLLLLSLFEAFAALRGPLILFLDDLQWMDAASHGFLRYLVINGPVPGILTVMACRSEDSENSQILEQTTSLYQNQDTILTMALSGLTKRDTRGFLKQRLDTGQDLTPLADICHGKTVGNPFYLTQLLDELLEKDVISRKNGEWIYDISFISGLGFTDNIIDLIVERLRLLDKDCLALLKQAACIQSDISVPLLAATSGFSRKKIETLLWKPVQLDLLRKTEDGFGFTHDRIQESLAALFSGDDEVREIHRRIVAFFLADEQRADLEKNTFTLLYHLDFYADTVTDGETRKQMTNRYFEAGGQARNRSAHGLALAYFIRGKAHFPGDIWTDDYGLALRFSHQLAECAYRAGDYALADRVFAEVAARSESFSDGLAVEMVKIPCYYAQNREEMALKAGLGILRHFGVRISRNPSEWSILFAVLRSWIRFILCRKDRLKRKQIPNDTNDYWVIRCLHALGAIAYYLSPQKLLPLVVAIGFNLTLKRGNVAESPVTYIGFGMILNEITGSAKWGRKLGALAREISRNFNDDRLKIKELTLMNVYLDHWDKTMARSIRDFKKAERFCLRQGDHEYFAYNAIGGLHCMMMSGIPLTRGAPENQCDKEGG